MELGSPPLELELALSHALANGPLASIPQQRLGKVLGKGACPLLPPWGALCLGDAAGGWEVTGERTKALEPTAVPCLTAGQEPVSWPSQQLTCPLATGAYMSPPKE